MASFPLMSLSNSPPPLLGDAQVASAQNHSLLVEESCGGGGQDGCQVWRGVQAQPCSACPKQPVHAPEPSAVYFTYILTWWSASSSLFHPWNETNPPIHTWATKASGSAGGTPWVSLLIFVWENKGLYFLEKYFKAVSFITNSPSCSIHYLL